MNNLPVILLGILLSVPVTLASAGEVSTPTSAFHREVEGVQAEAHRHPEGSSAYFTALERGFRRLQGTYPAEPQVYAELLFVADHTAGESSTRLLQEIIGWPTPSEVREKAAGVVRKRAALGQRYDLSLPALDQRTVRLADWRGKVVLIDFWATWCQPCRERIPELTALYAQYHAQGFEILGISFDDQLTKLRRYLLEQKIPWPQVADGRGWDESPYARSLGITSLPALWIVDRQGRLTSLEAGRDLRKTVAALIAEK